MSPIKATEKISYNGVTIFKYNEFGKTFYRLPAAFSSTKYVSLANAKKAIDKRGRMGTRRHKAKARQK